jgi:hypothetical protein
MITWGGPSRLLSGFRRVGSANGFIGKHLLLLSVPALAIHGDPTLMSRESLLLKAIRSL